MQTEEENRRVLRASKVLSNNTTRADWWRPLVIRVKYNHLVLSHSSSSGIRRPSRASPIRAARASELLTCRPLKGAQVRPLFSLHDNVS